MEPQARYNAMVENYNAEILSLREQWLAGGLREEEFWELYEEVLRGSERNIRKHRMLFTLAACIFLSLFIYMNYKIFTAIYSSHRNVTNSQDWIFPGLRLLRKIFIPIITLFPSITGLYQETCLVQNPLFKVVDMADCWPCHSVNNIYELRKVTAATTQPNTPFIYKTEQEVITIAELKHFYLSNKHFFDDEAPLILIDSRSFIIPSDMFSQHESGDEHTYFWEFNNMNVAKLLRKIIPRPEIVPKFGQSIERYVVVDSSQEEFDIPDTDCNYSFILALSGSRIIKLKPATECQHQCKTLYVKLDQTYLLWYNWWYWRAEVQPSTGNETFIAHTGSYC